MRYLRIISSHLSRSVKSLPRNCSSNPLPRENPNQLFTVQASKYASSAQQSRTPPSEKVSSIVDEITGLTLLEVMELTEVLRQKLDISEMPTMAVMMPGMGSPAKGAGKGGASGPGKGEEKKEEKTVFDVNLEGFDAAAKIKVIKEVRGFTDLGLKEAKDLVEKAPTLLKKGVTKEEAEKIIQKMKDAGAKVTME